MISIMGPGRRKRYPARTCSPEELARPVESQHHPVDRDYGKRRTWVGSFRSPTGHPVAPVSDRFAAEEGLFVSDADTLAALINSAKAASDDHLTYASTATATAKIVRRPTTTVATPAPLTANFITSPPEIGFAMALGLFAIFKCELLHYHAELMRGARQYRRPPQLGDTPAKPVQRPGAGRWLSGTPAGITRPGLDAPAPWQRPFVRALITLRIGPD
jgi:hypothetical protein